MHSNTFLLRSLATLLASCFALTSCTTALRPRPFGFPIEEFGYYEQNFIEPRIRGIAYNSRNETVLVSACNGDSFACDLLEAEMREGGRVRRLRNSHDWGYSHPIISPDGRVAAVRTPRGQRPADRSINQKLVELLSDGTDRVLYAAGGGRIALMRFVDEATVLLARSYRSESLRCRGGSCADVADFVCVREGRSEVLPLESAAVGTLTDIAPLAGGAYWIKFSGREVTDNAGGLPIRRGYGALFDASTCAVSEPVGHIDASTQLLQQAEQRYGSLGGWVPSQLIGGGVGPSKVRPFSAAGVSLIPLEQVTLISAQQGVMLVKEERPRRLRLVMFNGADSMSWRESASVTLDYPER